MLKRPLAIADLPQSVPIFPLTGALLLPFAAGIPSGEKSPPAEESFGTELGE